MTPFQKASIYLFVILNWFFSKLSRSFLGRVIRIESIDIGENYPKGMPSPEGMPLAGRYSEINQE
ncbi:MAG: hypothetical protein J7L46_06260 [Bacteroidales bacterium]|nr:hypothetical protein [Bacteroidales bacterium]